MAGYGLKRIKPQKERFEILEGGKDVKILFGQFAGLEISLIARLSPRYIRFLLDRVDMAERVADIIIKYNTIQHELETKLMGKRQISGEKSPIWRAGYYIGQ